MKTVTYCKICSKNILKQWKGWPQKDIIPILPILSEGICQICGSSDKLESFQISWSNYHGKYNTGLPDYWLLEITDQPNKWGQPYFNESNCPRCNNRSIISQINDPNGTREQFYNCHSCGIIKIGG